MARQALYNDLDLVPRGYKINPDWNRNFREDQDKVTKVIDQILDISIREYVCQERTMLQDVYFTKYWGWGNYCLVYKMKEDYDNLEVLFGAVLESTDEVLRWYDVTEFINFNVYIVTPYRTFRLTYLDLLYEYITMNHSRVSPITIYTHPRIIKMKEWIRRHQQYERYTRRISLVGDPYSYMDRSREQRELLLIRNDNRPISKEYRGEGIQQGYYNYAMGGELFYQQEQQRQQQMSELYERQSEPIVESDGFITKMRKKLKIKW